MEKTIEKYAHDYRDMKMTEEEITKMLNSFISESNIKLQEILDIADKKIYPYQDDKERLEIIKEDLNELLQVKE